MNKQIIHTSDAPQAIGPYVQAVKLGELLFTSGQLGIDMATGQLAHGVEAQAQAALVNLAAILGEAGSDMTKVIKSTVFVKDMADFAKVNQIYGASFDGAYPARSCVEVAALPMGALVEIECVAHV